MAPALIISGDHDVMLPDHEVAMSKLIASSRLLILPGTHGEYIGVAESSNTDSKMPELTVEIIKEFLKVQL